MNNNKKSRLKHAFNIRENFRDIYSSENSRMLFMDGLRCIGMFHVMLTHSLWAFLIGFKSQFQPFVQDVPWYLRWMLAGDKAVDLFFVISGFLIGQMLFREYNKTQKIDLKRFFLRRFWRLTPAYYLVILMVALTAGPNVEKIWLWAFAFYVNNYIPIQHNYIHFAWSLAIEEQFYAIFSAFVAFVFFKIRYQLSFLWFMYGLSFVILFCLLWLNPEIVLPVDTLISHVTSKADDFWQIIYDNLHTRYGAIVLGIILAHLYVYHWVKVVEVMSVSRCNWMLVAALGLFILSMVLPVYSGVSTPKALLYFYHVTHRNVFALGVMFIMMLCLLNIGLGARVNQFLSSKIFYPVSQLTYSMYLLHLPVIAFSYIALKNTGVITGISYQNGMIVFAAAVIPTIVFSSLMYVFVERPFMKLRN
jgi:peptidoglycan/LPS O-acetylase OafA/YrhL